MTKIIDLQQQKDNELEKLKESIDRFVNNGYDATQTYLDTILPRIEAYIESDNFISDFYALIREKLDDNDINIGCMLADDPKEIIGMTFIYLHIPFNKRIPESCELSEDVLGSKLEPYIKASDNYKRMVDSLKELGIIIQQMSLFGHDEYDMIYQYEILFKGKMAEYIISVYNHFDLHSFDKEIKEDKDK